MASRFGLGCCVHYHNTCSQGSVHAVQYNILSRVSGKLHQQRPSTSPRQQQQRRQQSIAVGPVALLQYTLRPDRQAPSQIREKAM